MESITFLNKDVDRVVDEMLAKKHELTPELPDDNIASLNRTLIETLAVQIAWMIKQLNVIGNQNYIKTATDYDAISHLCALISYQIPTAIPARTTLKITFRDSVLGDFITYPKWTQFATIGTSTEDRIIFETEEAVTKVPSMKSLYVPIVQGERVLNETLGSSDGSSFQTFTLENSPVIIDDSLEVYVIDESLVTVSKWTRVDSLFVADSDDEVYEISYDEDTAVTIKFGNGVKGKIPPVGTNSIYANYRIGGGSLGNVAANKITVMVSADSSFESCTNAAAASGGTDKQTLNETRLYGPNSIKYTDRVVATEDFGIRAMEYPGVARATQYPREFGENTVGVRIVPDGGGYPSDYLCIEVEHYILTRSTTTLDVYVHSVKYHNIYIEATVYLEEDASEDDVDDAIRDALDQFFDPTYINDDGEFEVEFGETIYLARLYQIIMDVGVPLGVKNVEFTIPATDETINHYELPILDPTYPVNPKLTYIQY